MQKDCNAIGSEHGSFTLPFLLTVVRYLRKRKRVEMAGVVTVALSLSPGRGDDIHCIVVANGSRHARSSSLR